MLFARPHRSCRGAPDRGGGAGHPFSRRIAAAEVPARVRLRRTFPTIVMVVAILVSFGRVAAAAMPPPTVIDAKIGFHHNITRLILGLTQAVDYQVTVLTDPHRIVVDLTDVGSRLDDTALPTGGVIGQVRHGAFRPGVYRIVVDLLAPASVRNTFVLFPRDQEPYRLVVDLVAADGSRPEVVRTEPPAPQIAAIGATAVPTPSLPRPRQRPQSRVVVLDPGHGGKDPGAIGVTGIREKDVALATARDVRDVLRALGPYKVVLTRDGDTFIRLRDRIAIARRVGASVFVSIHADAQDNPATRGASIYTLSKRASDAEAAALAERENKADVIAGLNLSRETPEVTNILIDLVQRETMNRSGQLAKILAHEIDNEAALLPNSHRFAGFAVLKAPDVASVLIELGFLSNQADEALLRQRDHRRGLAGAIARAIHGYFQDIEVAGMP
jgi:N-acetylmuramoyl-L-alanine amidase